MPHQPVVTLTDDERAILEGLVHRGKATARTLTRARILLKSAEGWSTAALAAAMDVCEATVTNVRRRFAQGGREAVLHDQVPQQRRRALSGLQMAHLLAVACRPSPEGHDPWTVRLLARDRCRLGVCDEHLAHVHPDPAQKNEALVPGRTSTGVCPRSAGSLSPRWKTCWTCTKRSMIRSIPPSAPIENPVVLHADVQPSIPVEPGHPERVDYEYERRGTRTLFVLVEPLAGWRHVEVTAQRTRQAYAKVVRWLVDEVYPQAEYSRLVQDHLNTHTPASLYETVPPADARRILQRWEFHYTPKHGSWLNRAEIESAILERNALSHRLGDEAALRPQVLAVETERNAQRRGIAWQFTSRDARRKLERLYPVKAPSADGYPTRGPEQQGW